MNRYRVSFRIVELSFRSVLNVFVFRHRTSVLQCLYSGPGTGAVPKDADLQTDYIALALIEMDPWNTILPPAQAHVNSLSRISLVPRRTARRNNC